MSARLPGLAWLPLILLLAACSPPPPDEQETAAAAARAAAERAAAAAPGSAVAPPPAGHCDAAAVQPLAGQAYTDALGEQARHDAHAARLRTLRPGQAVTLEYDGDRLNLELDAQGRIVALRCG